MVPTGYSLPTAKIQAKRKPQENEKDNPSPKHLLFLPSCKSFVASKEQPSNMLNSAIHPKLVRAQTFPIHKVTIQNPLWACSSLWKTSSSTTDEYEFFLQQLQHLDDAILSDKATVSEVTYDNRSINGRDGN